MLKLMTTLIALTAIGVGVKARSYNSTTYHLNRRLNLSGNLLVN